MDDRYRTSLEVSKRLKEVGFPQNGCDCYWCDSSFEWYLAESEDAIDNEVDYDEIIAAPCVGRLGDELKDKHVTLPPYINGSWHCRENKVSTEADARALMWIELKQKGVL
jgi:hypothetical protein